jgi:predicted phage tail protein
MRLYRKNDNGNITQRTLANEYRYDGTPSKDRFFIVDDGVLPRSPMNRLSFLTKDQTAVIIEKPDEKDFERVKLMNNPQVKKLSDLPRSVTTSKGSKIKRGEVKKSDILKFDKSGYRWTQASYWSEFDEEIDPNQTYYYYVYYANKVEMNGMYIEPYTISNRVGQLKKIRKDLDQVYGVRAKALKKFEKLSNWIRLDEVEQDWIKNDKNLYQQKRHDCLEDLLEFAMRNSDYRNVLEEVCKKNNANKVILNFKKLMDECKSLRAKNKNIQVNMSGIEIDMSKEEQVKSDFLNRYPMAQYCFGHHSDSFEKDFANYLANW